MAGHRIIVMGASAGGIEALTQVVRTFPPDLDAAVFVVVHFPVHATSALPRILSRAGALPALHARDEEKFLPGRIYVAPPNHHLLLRPDHIRVVVGPRENGHRPAVDPLFRSAALYFGERVLGVILSGSLDDGTSGLSQVKARGGVAVVQDPDEALYSGMPRSAIENVDVDYIVPVAEMGALLAGLALDAEPLTIGETDADDPVSEAAVKEDQIEEFASEALEDPHQLGIPSGYGCPDCGGALWDLRDGSIMRFRCRVGHAWTANSLFQRQSEALEEALWTAIRALEERAELSGRIARRARKASRPLSAVQFEREEDEARRRAEMIRQLILQAAGDQPRNEDMAQEEKSGKV